MTALSSRSGPARSPPGGNMSACLVVFMNHRYEANLPVLRRMYGQRFPKLIFLVPFYEGEESDVMPVYENSFRFEGFFAQAASRLSELDATHFVFCADDLVLNPILGAKTIAASLSLDGETAYIQNLGALCDTPFSWPHAVPSILRFRRTGSELGVEWEREIPSKENAFRISEARGLVFKRLSFRQFSGFHWRWDWKEGLLLLLGMLLKPTSWRSLPYPLVMSYSDFLVVPATRLSSFAHYCGVFAAMGVHPEVAVPTALSLSCDSFVVEDSFGQNVAVDPLGWHGVALWNDGREALLQDHHASLSRLLDGFAERQLYVHPVKLSQWTDDLEV